MPKRLYVCDSCGCGEEAQNFCFYCDQCLDCCECDTELFDADELGLDPEDDEKRRWPNA